jgi:hypothetical protein
VTEFGESGVAGYAIAGLAVCGVSVDLRGGAFINMPTGRRKKREPGAAESVAKPATEVTADLVAAPVLRTTETQFRQRENEKAVLLLMLH